MVRQALLAGDTVVGVRNGWSGLLGDGDMVPLGRRDVAGILQLGGTVLCTSSRINPLDREGGAEEAVTNFRHAGLDALIAIGGDGTLGIASVTTPGTTSGESSMACPGAA